MAHVVAIICVVASGNGFVRRSEVMTGRPLDGRGLTEGPASSTSATEDDTALRLQDCRQTDWSGGSFHAAAVPATPDRFTAAPADADADRVLRRFYTSIAASTRRCRRRCRRRRRRRRRCCWTGRHR